MSNGLYATAAVSAALGVGMIYLGLTRDSGELVDEEAFRPAKIASEQAKTLKQFQANAEEYGALNPSGESSCELPEGLVTVRTAAAAARTSRPAPPPGAQHTQEIEETRLRIKGEGVVAVLGPAYDRTGAPAPVYWRLQAAPGALAAVILTHPHAKIAKITPPAPLIRYDKDKPNCPKLSSSAMARKIRSGSVFDTPKRRKAPSGPSSKKAILEAQSALLEGMEEGMSLPRPFSAHVLDVGDTIYLH